MQSRFGARQLQERDQQDEEAQIDRSGPVAGAPGRIKHEEQGARGAEYQERPGEPDRAPPRSVDDGARDHHRADHAGRGDEGFDGERACVGARRDERVDHHHRDRDDGEEDRRSPGTADTGGLAHVHP